MHYKGTNSRYLTMVHMGVVEEVRLKAIQNEACLETNESMPYIQ